MMGDINDENAYSDTVNKLSSFLAELSKKIVPADITKEESYHSLEKMLKFVRTSENMQVKE